MTLSMTMMMMMLIKGKQPANKALPGAGTDCTRRSSYSCTGSHLLIVVMVVLMIILMVILMMMIILMNNNYDCGVCFRYYSPRQGWNWSPVVPHIVTAHELAPKVEYYWSILRRLYWSIDNHNHNIMPLFSHMNYF